MRIGFTGAQGSGKTTLAKLLEQDRSVQFVPSTARIAMQSGYKINTEADPLSQLLTTVSRFTAEQDAIGDIIVSDRTLLDSLAYTTYQFNHVWQGQDRNDFYMQTSFDFVADAMLRYDYIFYFPPYFAPEDDGVRSADLEYQAEIDANIVLLIQEMNLRVYTVPHLSPLKRLEWLYETIDEVGNLTNATKSHIMTP